MKAVQWMGIGFASAVLFASLACLFTNTYIAFPRSQMIPVNVQVSSLPGYNIRQEQKVKVTRIVYVKIPKTGSSTLQGILTRFSLAHSLNTLIPTNYCYYNESQKQVWRIGPRKDERADIMGKSVVYSKQELDSHMKLGYKIVISVREPVSWMTSASFYWLKQHPEQTIMNDDLLFKRSPNWKFPHYHLRQMFLTGFDYDRQKGNVTAMKEHVASFIKRIDIPVLTEQYDASLLIMMKRFNWDYTDIFCNRYTISGRKEIPELSETAKAKLLSPDVNFGEKLLYDAINKTWWEQPEVKDESFWEEVKYFTYLNDEVSQTYCVEVIETKEPITIKATAYHGKILLTYEYCEMIRLDKVALKKRLLTYAGVHYEQLFNEARLMKEMSKMNTKSI